MGTTFHIKINVRMWQTEIIEKGIGHIEIIVLARMDKNRVGPALFLERVIERSYFHKIGSSGTYKMNHHGSVILHFIAFP